MKVRVEFPGKDIIDENEARIMMDDQKGFYIVSDNFFVWISETDTFISALLKSDEQETKRDKV